MEMYTHAQRKLPRIQHVSLAIPPDRQSAARAFYGAALGFKEKPTPADLDIPGLLWFAVSDEGLEIHLIPDALQSPVPGQQHFCLEVDDVAVYRDRLQSAGYKVIEADVIFNRPRCFCYDPFGNMIELTTILGEYKQTEASEMI